MSLEINVTEMKLYIQEYNLYCSLHLVREDTASSYSKKNVNINTLMYLGFQMSNTLYTLIFQIANRVSL